MFCRNFMFMPVHTCECGSKYLHAIHANIANTCIWIFGIYNRQCNKSPAIFRPAFHHRKFCDVGIAHHNLTPDQFRPPKFRKRQLQELLGG